MEQSRRKKVLAILLIAIILMSSTVSFAFFTSVLDNSKPETAILKTGTMSLTFEDDDNGINKKIGFGESVVKKFKIINTGNVEASLSLDFDQMINTYLNGSLTYNLTRVEKSEDESTTEWKVKDNIIKETNMPVSDDPIRMTLAPELSVPAGSTYYYNLTITLNNTTFDQEDDLYAVYNTRFNVGEPTRYRYYRLTVDPNGGNWGEYTAPQEYLLKNKETMSITETPTKTGATFLGWKLVGVSSKCENNTFTMGIGDARLIAEWEMNKYNLTLNLNGGTYDGELPTEIAYSSTLELNTPTKEGYIFKGWSTEVGSINGNIFTMDDTSDVVITANWISVTQNYKVIHRQMKVSGSGYDEVDIEEGTFAYGKPFDAPLKSYEGFTSPEKQTITIGEGDNIVTYDYTRNQYTLTVDPKGGEYSGSTSITMYYKATTTIPDPSKNGYTFGGWKARTDAMSGTTYTMGAGDETIEAKWTPRTYKYIVYHDKMNLDGSTYTTADTTPGEGLMVHQLHQIRSPIQDLQVQRRGHSQ